MDRKKWRQLVAEGRRLVLEGAAARLRLGEIAQLIAPKEAHGGGNRREPGEPASDGAVHDALVAFAAEVDVEERTLREYRDISLLWGGVAGAPKASWSVLRELAREDDPWGAYDAVRAQFAGRVTILTVREYRGKRSAGVRSTSPIADKIEQAKTLMADPDVAEAVMADAPVRKTVAKADHKVQTKKAAKRKAAARAAKGDEEADAEEAAMQRNLSLQERLRWINKLGACQENLQQLLTYLRKVELTDADREVFLQGAQAVRVSLDWFDALLRHGGGAVDWDAALASMTKGGGAQ